MQGANFARSMGVVKPLTNHLGPLGKPEEGGMTRSEASAKGAAVKRLIESEGWAVLQEQVEARLRHEQKTLMLGRADEDNAGKERKIGQWAGMVRVPALAAAVIQYGEQASREMETGEAAEAV